MNTSAKSLPHHLDETNLDMLREELAEMDAPQLRDMLARVLDGVNELRKQVDAKNSLEATVAQLRDANQHLVVATVDAQNLRDEAEATNRRQNEFLAMLAHELRNPLSPISMAASIIKKMPDASPQLLNLQAVIGRQVDHMSRLLDDLLDAARVSSGKIQLSTETVRLSDMIDRTIETIQPRIDERRQSLRVSVAAHDVMVDGDSVRLIQIFSNLLGNASKYTRDGGEVGLSVRRDGDDVVITVYDNGDGISPDVLPHIFDLFTQGPRSLARSEGGLGIGLNVVRNLVSMHGGSVKADSAGLGRGSRFTVTLPVSKKVETQQSPFELPKQSVQRLNVLVIEDNVDACETLQALLGMEGHMVDAAYDGSSGLAAAVAKPYDVLICDIGLPHLDGFELIRKFRQSVQGKKTFAIAVTGYGQSEDRRRAMKAGFDHYLIKPINSPALLTLLASDESHRH